MRTLLPILGLCTISAVPVSADDAGLEFFEKKVRPVLVENCYKCHSSEARKPKGGLLLDNRDGLRKGGESGLAIVPGKPDESLLIKAVRYAEPGLKMPPKGRLPDAVIADLEKWVAMGAPDPRTAAPSGAVLGSWEEMLKTRRQWWSLQPVRRPELPAVRDGTWSAHPVDRFILAKLDQAALTPAAPADKRTLIRRVSLVLTGLPPTPAEVEAFLADDSPNAYEKLVDRLLASPHFGERWARHWMDVVRFTETHGNEWNYEVHHAWRYRDYLIRAFNDDVPFDQLIREHIAGDLLPNPRRNQHEGFNESVIGTAFYRFGEVNHDDCISLPQLGFDIIDNQIDTLGKAFQATTIACARCHDHKIDAVSMKDYYALLGALRSSRLVSHTIDSPQLNAESTRRLRELKIEIRTELAKVWLHEALDVGRYLLAAQAKVSNRSEAAELAKGLDSKRLDNWVAALKVEKAPLEELFSPWRALHAGKPPAFEAEWTKLAERYVKEDRERTEFNATSFKPFADFRGSFGGWQVGGHGLRDGPSRSGDFALNGEGDALIKSILPAGTFTHTLSDKLNGTLRSANLPNGIKNISFQVMGQRSSAVRLVSNHCQLNYKNYRALLSDELQWVTLQPPEDAEGLRCYAELMTMLDNPKFPDQLATLGGDKENYRLPWEKAAANPRSFFGITRVVAHDDSEPPKPELSHLRRLFVGQPGADAPRSPGDVAGRYAAAVESAVQAWAIDWATDDDVRWLDGLLRRGLLGNHLRLSPRLEKLAGQYRDIEKALASPRIVPGMGDFGPGIEQPVFARGDCTRPGEFVPRRYLEVLSKTTDRFASPSSGRLELAERITSADNPLTARVMVNRVWHHLFGTGLVRTVDDFGRVGDVPSHPELLDYLANEFVASGGSNAPGWSTKRLIRSLVLTQTFQLSSQPSATAKERDPERRLLQHYPARRMEAEAIRDGILSVSGRLDRTCYGMSISPYRAQEYADRRLFPGPLDGAGRRSVYIKNNLMELPHFLGAFNTPGGKVAQGRRDVTNVPAQALALLNDPFVLQQAGVWAERLVARSDALVIARLEHMVQVAFGRPPEPDELRRFEQAVAQFTELHAVPATDVLKSRAVWKDVAHAMFNMQEFVFIP